MSAAASDSLNDKSRFSKDGKSPLKIGFLYALTAGGIRKPSRR